MHLYLFEIIYSEATWQSEVRHFIHMFSFLHFSDVFAHLESFYCYYSGHLHKKSCLRPCQVSTQISFDFNI